MLQGPLAACFIAAAAGLWTFHHPAGIRVCALVLLGVTVIHSLFTFGARYRIPYDALVFLVAAGTIDAWRAKRRSPT